MKIRTNTWKKSLSAVWIRFTNALKSVTFMVYFVIGIIVIGGTGIWLEMVIMDKLFVNTLNFFTFSMAILGTLALEGLISSNNNKSLTSLAIILGVMSIAFLGFGYKNTIIWQVIIGSGLTLLLFLLVNANDEKFDDPTIQNYLGSDDLDPNALPD